MSEDERRRVIITPVEPMEVAPDHAAVGPTLVMSPATAPTIAQRLDVGTDTLSLDAAAAAAPEAVAGPLTEFDVAMLLHVDVPSIGILVNVAGLRPAGPSLTGMGWLFERAQVEEWRRKYEPPDTVPTSERTRVDQLVQELGRSGVHIRPWLCALCRQGGSQEIADVVARVCPSCTAEVCRGHSLRTWETPWTAGTTRFICDNCFARNTRPHP